MAKFSTILLAAVALVAGVQAACPPNGLFCGSELLDVYQCVTRAQLARLTPPGDEINTDIYPTGSDGSPGIPGVSCKQTGCKNSNGDKNTPPTVYAQCF
ncbi:hypothetical protein B0T25DRAFT_553645 [Lasiosphaeria hispida]|uniref:Uncharacterized protein n=1 Tax=Lasiosphaeria hispida TaxID=260671 RepID=A0AAJ0MBP0_9PEZI|nr:hypothetical protein B0T25DRAFT_553645 [Lasiosphaeria hispida]